MTEPVLISAANGVLRLTLSRPHKKNALTQVMYATLADALTAAGETADHRVVLIDAVGDDFCAGNDIADFVTLAQSEGSVEDLPVFRFLKALTYCARPLVFAVQGQAVGVGTTMLLHGDLVYLSDEARLSLPFLKLGLTPEGGSSQLLPARIGHARAFEWLAFGQPLGAAEALGLGLCNAVTPRDDLLNRAQLAAERLAALSPDALKQAKGLMRDPDGLWAHIVREGGIFRARLNSAEAAQAFAAFLKA
ncbi:enoyl-CoA hydratase-related protein [Asticcacaulis sp. BYS171W]|uniref:Enoyl-CoA hydratase-related protein n=1 Tax=Asticcacaulis aquaticus TaxID=2984212 RepID=A0ABT5HV11_9CAUL|nr:enoyl-CoA hydratase-related protein [Asticcacaulis aquaticus]MDC7683814.1 enoyl-CoA hydratase-related protein [Asticcacaulis aquaticus]